jgi:hypothetical protein
MTRRACRFLLERYSLERRRLAGSRAIWRIGLMGADQRANVEPRPRAALEEQGWRARADPLPVVHAFLDSAPAARTSAPRVRA